MKNGMTLKLKLVISCICIAVAGATCALVLALCLNNKITISYVLDGTEYSQQYEKGVLVEEIKKPTVKEGYYFDGWFEDAQYSQKLSDKTQINESKKLYPKLSAKDAYSLIYCANNNSNEVEVEYYKYDETIKAKENTWTKENYEFVGWSESRETEYFDVDDIVTEETQIEMQSATKTLYAIWRGRQLTVKYELSTIRIDGDEVEYSDLNSYYGQELVLPDLEYANHFEDDSLEFGGFLVNGVVYENGATVTLTSSNDFVTITPNWVSGAKLYVNFKNPENGTLSQFEFDGDALSTHLYDFATMTDTANGKTLSQILEEIELTHFTFKGFGVSLNANLHLNSIFQTNKFVATVNAIFGGVQRKIVLYNNEQPYQEHLLCYGQYFVLPHCECGNDVYLGYSTLDYSLEKPQFSGEITVNFEDEITNLYSDFKQVA